MSINLSEFEKLPTAIVRGDSLRGKIYSNLDKTKAFNISEICKMLNVKTDDKKAVKRVKQAINNLKRDKRVAVRSGYVLQLETKEKK